MAYELLRARPGALSAATLADVKRFAKGMDSWSDVDCFGCFVAGVAWRLKRIDDRDVADYALSRDRWRRRAALVATILDDRDDMVVKAMSWALRELAKRDARAVRTFLRTQGHRLAPRVRREVLTKIVTGRKTVLPRLESTR